MQKIMMIAAAAVLATGAGVARRRAQSKLKVGFVYLGPVGDFGWTYQHELGRREVVKALRQTRSRPRIWRTSTKARTPSARSSSWRAPATS